MGIDKLKAIGIEKMGKKSTIEVKIEKKIKRNTIGTNITKTGEIVRKTETIRKEAREIKIEKKAQI